MFMQPFELWFAINDKTSSIKKTLGNAGPRREKQILHLRDSKQKLFEMLDRRG